MVEDIFTIGCLRHHVSLKGQPKMKVKQQGPSITFWEIDILEMECPEGKKECASSWRVGRG